MLSDLRDLEMPIAAGHGLLSQPGERGNDESARWLPAVSHDDPSWHQRQVDIKGGIHN